MRIQRVPIQPVAPLATLEEDYHEAVVHLAWTAHEQAAPGLLFAMVELLPAEVPPPLDDGPQTGAIGQGGEYQLHLRRVVVSARRALTWYLDCRRGRAVLPADDGALGQADDDGVTLLTLADLGEVPDWPALVCVSSGVDTAPFCANWHRTPQVHHLLPLADLSPDGLWPDAGVRAQAFDWLAHRLHFRLEDYPQYLGSIHLVAPNPVYRRVDARLLTDTAHGEAELVRLHARAGHTVEGLALTLTEEPVWGPLSTRRVVLDGPTAMFDFDHRLDATRMSIVDARRGVLHAQPQAYRFIRSISVNMQVSSSNAPDRPMQVTTRLGRDADDRAASTGGSEKMASAWSQMSRLHDARRKARAEDGE